ncbi:MAG: FAD-dependent oxidoreductase [Candidatus Omnitrophica bacterium]|nr:FAD-dependent oxidoreductase [Candidatus Omnitrophota bacterium]
MSKRIIILGAGLSGLSAAYHLQNGCCVYEQEDEAGGLARSDKINGFTFDYDGHLLHFKTEYVKKLTQRLLPGLFVAHNRNSWVFSHNVFTKYPFQANTYGLPPEVVKKCILGMFDAASKKKLPEGVNLAQWMLHNFGEGITRHFMYPYNYKFWTLPPEKLIPDWTERYVPHVNLKTVLTGAFSLKTKPLGYNSVFWYPKAGGINRIAKALAENVNNIKTGHKMNALDLKNKKIFFENGSSAKFTDLVLTTPLKQLQNLIKDKLPKEVKQAFSGLKYVSIFNLNLGIQRENISDKHWIYFPEDKFCFFRVGFPTNFSKGVAPCKTSSLYAEVSYSKFRQIDKKKIAASIETDLVKAGILNPGDKILTRHINDIKYGYVIYDKLYRYNIKIINDYLLKNNIYSAGRFGRWKYMSMEDVILDGKLISDFIKKR